MLRASTQAARGDVGHAARQLIDDAENAFAAGIFRNRFSRDPTARGRVASGELGSTARCEAPEFGFSAPKKFSSITSARAFEA
jgi:hypothetical protein